MDIILGLTTKDSTLLATSKGFVRGISVLKDSDDKTIQLSDHELMAFTGEAGDTSNFAEFLQANVQLDMKRNGIEMSHKAVSSYARNTLANALRSRKPYQVNLLIGGYDTRQEKPLLNWIDYLAANVQVPYSAHGYAAFYVLSLLDRHYIQGMSEEDGVKLLNMCVEELRRRMPLDFKGVQVKAVDKDGVRQLEDL